MALLEGTADFLEFLRQKFAADFEAWRATGGKRTEAAAVCPEDLEDVSVGAALAGGGDDW